MNLRDYSAVFHEQSCVVCGDSPADREAHVAQHLSEGRCVVELDYRKTPPVERVLVTATIPTRDADGSIWDCTASADPERKDANSQALREAYGKAAALNRETARQIRAASKPCAQTKGT